ncbi:hypothetical protein TBLA_0D00170 [Henningerozyma blattae CBS 6284]|uniref:glucan endo-1,3-beta-D-glucosidase n=1 Tax=Henningerozyma blattae (strain ATCC 34711 / CBS 6284 / DSM 70876 / NBRC 10599 / NRRL Y-10934 / UCD 77-7) TaxID=1071380 RepID=I2H2C5_HENB6|nr:hypothetical protein TBLA_0D00170 [Tetrapisispora blattae CBS 6284]CCH60527.1 hypothetical protein TBLA_0D00170 [Tetrapisispora blattae CBS 6284]
MKFDTSVLLGLASLLAGISQAADDESQGSNRLEFSNIGYTGYYEDVQELKHIWQEKKCLCKRSREAWFHGTNAPLSEYLSIQVRGPVALKQFGYYHADYFAIGDPYSNSTSWTRGGYYNSVSGLAENVTFLNNYGAQSPCLGGALAYTEDDGMANSEIAHTLKGDNLIPSGREYSIYSNKLCPHSGVKNGCGVYRHGIPAYYGFYGKTKMFLFEFEMPHDSRPNMTAIPYYDLPAISLLNDRIPRTSLNPTNELCNCVTGGCGVYNVFEAKNGTENNHLYSTLFTNQVGGQLATGFVSDGWIERTDGVMRGGVIMDSAGNIVTFMNNNTIFDASISASDVESFLSQIPQDQSISTQIAAAVPVSSTKTKKK